MEIQIIGANLRWKADSIRTLENSWLHAMGEKKCLLFLDIDECVVDTTLCANGMCTNTDGSYTCSPCDSGYELNDDSTACNGKDVKSN